MVIYATVISKQPVIYATVISKQLVLYATVISKQLVHVIYAKEKYWYKY